MTPKYTPPEDQSAILAALRAPMQAQIHWKLQSVIKARTYDKGKRYGLCVAYIDARDVAERLDNVVGLDWHAEYTVIDTPANSKLLVVECALTVRGHTRTDVGSVDKNDANAYKSAYSDALKRAAVQFGVGRHVYRLPLVEAQIDVWTSGDREKGRILRDADKELRKLTAPLLKGERLPALAYCRVLSEAQRAELPGDWDRDSTDSEAAADSETDGERTLSGHEAAQVLSKVRDSGIDEATLVQIAAQGFKRDVTSLKDVYVSELDALLDFARVYYRRYLDPKRPQEASN